MLYYIQMASKFRKAESISHQNINLSLCLAKTDREGDVIGPGMSVEEHDILAGYTAGSLFEMFYNGLLLPFSSKEASFIASLHDIGKVSSTFQNRIYNRLKDIIPAPSFVDIEDCEYFEATAHEKVSMTFLKDYGKVSGVKGDWDKIGYIAGAHHGSRTISDTALSEQAIFGGLPYHECRIRLFNELLKKFPCNLPLKLKDEEVQFLIGLTVVADWISSDCKKSDLKGTDEIKLATRKLREAGFSPLRFKKNLSFKDIFSFEPRENQKTFYESIKGRGIYILEEIMGGGKTEAAFYAAYRLLSEGFANGIYFALPTKLTSLSIYGRMEDFIKKITENKSETKLIFKDSDLFLCGENGENSPNGSWFDIGKKGILAPFGVGTIDQALMSVINVKHSALRSFGLAGKVLIIDELHSYDDYTGTLITELVSQVRKLGGTVIILSATMRNTTKEKVLGWKPQMTNYPLITASVNKEQREIPSQKYEVKTVSIVHSEREAALDKAVEMSMNGSRVLWIENTVAEAQNTFNVLSARLAGTNTKTGLIHSRFMQKDRKDNENRWISVFGKGAIRDGAGKVLVGTQVLEQSLDIDADFMVTNIAPIDMIFQRIGRLWRHREHDSERNCTQPECWIIHPSLETIKRDPQKSFGVSSFVYSPYVLYRTAKTLSTTKSLQLPVDIRPMIEKTYTEEAPENSKIKETLNLLNKERNEMESLARRANSININTGKDTEAKTRYGQDPSVTLYMVQEFCPKDRTIRFSDGSTAKLSDHPSIKDRLAVAKKLMMNSVSLRKKDAPLEAYENRCLEILSKYVYTGKGEEKESGILVLENETVSDVFGNRIENHFYNKTIGYRINN